MNNQEKKNAARSFATAFAASLGSTLASVTGTKWSYEAMESPDSSAQKGVTLHFRMTLEGGLSGECFVEFYEPQILAILSEIAKEPVAEIGSDHLDAVTKIIASAAEALSGGLESEYGQVSFRVDRVAGLAFGGMFVVPLASNVEDPATQVLLYFGPQLLEAFVDHQLAEAPGQETDRTAHPRNLQLVMDVELNVSLRFGQRQLQLREVLDLASGSIVELDRMVDEPVELFLDGKLIARGEAVVVDGNYGLKVTEIPQPVASHFLN
jgi:flagellar motor switch protein FliN